ncbi:MAG TPA: MFS transporter [Pyrinomonadaceae bacterium]|nr:MFS transporter [Pyrinomonadaceae bacterium]
MSRYLLMGADSRNGQFILASLHLVFLLSGIATVLIGQVLPHFSRAFALDDLQLSYFFPAQFSGSLLGTLAIRWFSRSQRLLESTILGAFLMSVGLLLMNAGQIGVCLTGFFVNGLGIGLTLPAINLLVIRMNPESPASSLSFLNFFWGAGAIVSKPFVDMLSGENSILLPTTLLASAICIMVLPLIVIRSPFSSPGREDNEDNPRSRASIWLSPFAWGLALFNFVHVGFESGMGGWLTTYTDRLTGVDHTHFISPTLVYFLCFVIGRAIAPLWFRFADENGVITVSLFVLLAGTALIIAAENLLVLGIGAAIAGLGTSAIFPTNLSRFYRRFGKDAIRDATPLFLFGTIGAATITWSMGLISKRSGDLRHGMIVLVAAMLVLIILQLYLSKTERQN